MEMVTRDGVLLSEESNVVSDTSYTRAQAKRSDQPSERGLNCAMRKVKPDCSCSSPSGQSQRTA